MCLMLVVSGCSESGPNQPEKPQPETPVAARTVPARRYEEVETSILGERFEGIPWSDDYFLRVRVYNDDDVTFQIEKVNNRFQQSLVKEGHITDLTKVKTETTHKVLINLLFISTNKLNEVMEFLHKTEEWEETARKNDLRDIKKDMPNPWNMQMTFMTYSGDTNKNITAWVTVGDQILGEAIFGHDREKIRTLLSRLDNCILQAKEKMKRMQGDPEQAERQRKANELLK